MIKSCSTINAVFFACMINRLITFYLEHGLLEVTKDSTDWAIKEVSTPKALEGVVVEAER